MSRPGGEAPSGGHERGDAAPDRYVVVARRYRPQGFDDLVGQDTVSAALRNAIRSGRVGHAYLFTGARGVGKTSTARIFAKALNCRQGPTDTPCNECDICQRIATGDDVDVLEIDGASNRGIDEIRQLRSNVGVRPSRARYKIYIIDEVHMLTKEAFNALLKTLEEPPEHVKFLFCTTDPDRIPITVLSRCQRYDFPPVETPRIVERLAEIVAAEGAEAEPEALQLIARRAAGSVRDSQSLLEQILAFSGQRITAELVHRMLGTAAAQHVERLVDALMNRDAALVLRQLDETLQSGVDAGQLSEQLLAYLRDLLVLASGGQPDQMLTVAPASTEHANQLAAQWGVETMLAAVQVLDQAIVRMRRSMHPRIQLELALVRIARLDDLESLSELVDRLRQSGSAPGAASGSSTGSGASSAAGAGRGVAAPTPARSAAVSKKKTELTSVADAEDMPSSSGDRGDGGDGSGGERNMADGAELWPWESLVHRWPEIVSRLDGVLANYVGHAERVTADAPPRLVLVFPQQYNASKLYCERPDRRRELEEAVLRCSGRAATLEFELSAAQRPATAGVRQRQRAVVDHPWVRSARELFGAEVREVTLGAASNDDGA